MTLQIYGQSLELDKIETKPGSTGGEITVKKYWGWTGPAVLHIGKTWLKEVATVEAKNGVLAHRRVQCERANVHFFGIDPAEQNICNVAIKLRCVERSWRKGRLACYLSINVYPLEPGQEPLHEINVRYHTRQPVTVPAGVKHFGPDTHGANIVVSPIATA